MAARVSPAALGGARVRTLEGWGSDAGNTDGDAAGRLPDPGRLGGAWPGLLGTAWALDVASIARLGMGEMGLLLGAAWTGLLGAAELLLEEALMGRLGTG